MANFMKLIQFHVPNYAAAPTQEAKFAAIADYVRGVLKAMDVKLPEFDKAVDAKQQADVLMGWLKEQEAYLLKPMNCPHHILLYKSQMHSYRELPVRYAEFATLYRDEKAGTLTGLTRVRSLTQDDAHIFLRPDQLQEEFDRAINLALEVFNTYGLTDYWISLSLRDPAKQEEYAGDAEIWDRAESARKAVVKNKGIEFRDGPWYPAH